MRQSPKGTTVNETGEEKLFDIPDSWEGGKNVRYNYFRQF